MEALAFIAFIVWILIDQHKDSKKPSNRREQGQHFPPGFPPGFPIPGPETQEQMPQNAEQRSPLGFEIPHIEGAPGDTVEIQEYPIDYEESSIYTEYAEDYYSTLETEPDETPVENQTVPKFQESGDESEKKWLPLLKTPETARDAVVYAEIFGKPKALRRRH